MCNQGTPGEKNLGSGNKKQQKRQWMKFFKICVNYKHIDPQNSANHKRRKHEEKTPRYIIIN